MIYLLNAINAIICIVFLKNFLHVFQLKDYNYSRYLKHFSAKYLLFEIPLLLILILQIVLKNIYFCLCTNLIVIIASVLAFKSLITSKKTPIVFTVKLKRLYVLCSILIITINILNFGVALCCFSMIFLPIKADLLNIYDKLKNLHYINKASRKIKKSKTKVIAITGSNGKTSVKNILYEMLSTKYDVQATPKSFNTPLGISKFINKNLKKSTEFLILEYGARHKNDVKFLCKKFGADLGIITTISPQHIETFKNVESIYKAKNALAIFLKNKLCIFNLDNIYTFRMFQEKSGEKTGVSLYFDTKISVKNIKIKDFKTEFDINLTKQYRIKTNLLGRHNVTNILLATSLAKSLKVPDESILDCIEKLNPTPHRLEYIKSHINILDDSYNCSLISAKEALWVLNELKGKKMVVTPGIVECGKYDYEINFKLGKMCAVADYLVVVGNINKKAILDGLKSQNCKTIKFEANSLEEAKQYFSKLKLDDNLLLLNDLPDDYN